MAILFTDGFDNYGTTTGTNILTRWTSASNPTTGVITSTTPYGYGQAHYAGSGSAATSTITYTATPTITVGAAVYVFAGATSINYPIFGLLSSATWMMGLSVQIDGGIAVTRMTSVGAGTTLVASGTNPGTIRTGRWYYIEFSITISDTVGTVRVDVDGRTVINQTGLDTRNGTPTTVNTLALGTNNGAGVYFDDLYISDSITPLGPQRIYTLKPNADTVEKDWAPTAGWWISRTGSNETGAFATKGNIFTAVANTTLKGVSINFYAQAMTGILGIAELSSVNPGTVSTILYESSPFTRTAVAGYQSFTFPDITFTATKVYAIYITRTDGTTTSSAPLIWQASIDNVDPTGALVGSGWISKADTSITVSDNLYRDSTFPIYNMILNYATTNNYQGVQDTYDIDADTSYVTASTVGDFDLYDVEAYPAANANIKAVNQIVWAKKTDATARTMNLTTKSGATTTDSTAVTLATDYAGYSKIYETDPDTASAWTVSNINALQVGQKVAS